MKFVSEKQGELEIFVVHGVGVAAGPGELVAQVRLTRVGEQGGDQGRRDGPARGGQSDRSIDFDDRHQSVEH